MKKRTWLGCIVALGATAWLLLAEPSDWKIVLVPYAFAALMVDPTDVKDVAQFWKDS